MGGAKVVRVMRGERVGATKLWREPDGLTNTISKHAKINSHAHWNPSFSRGCRILQNNVLGNNLCLKLISNQVRNIAASASPRMVPGSPGPLEGIPRDPGPAGTPGPIRGNPGLVPEIRG